MKGDRGIGCQDMVLIEKMSENEIIENLRTRNRFLFLLLTIYDSPFMTKEL